MLIGRLLFPFGMSLLVHLGIFAVFVLLLPDHPGGVVKQVFQVSIKEGRATRVVESSSVEGSPPGFESSLGNPGSTFDHAKTSAMHDSSHFDVPADDLQERPSDSGAFESSDLDAGLSILGEPTLEPEYGFADDAVGSVELAVLVNPDGKPTLVWHSETSLDEHALAYMSNALRSVRFTQPRRNGFPVFGIFRVRVTIEPPSL